MRWWGGFSLSPLEWWHILAPHSLVHNLPPSLLDPCVSTTFSISISWLLGMIGVAVGRRWGSRCGRVSVAGQIINNIISIISLISYHNNDDLDSSPIRARMWLLFNWISCDCSGWRHRCHRCEPPLSPKTMTTITLSIAATSSMVLVQDGIGIDGHVITRRHPIVMKCCGIFVADDSIVQEECVLWEEVLRRRQPWSCHGGVWWVVWSICYYVLLVLVVLLSDTLVSTCG